MRLTRRIREQHPSVQAAEVVLLAMLGYMAIEAVRAQRKASLWDSARRIAADPWGAFTFKDFYMNTALISLWTLARERRRSSAFAWIMSYMLLGSLGTIPYVLKELLRLPPGASVRDLVRRPL